MEYFITGLQLLIIFIIDYSAHHFHDLSIQCLVYKNSQKLQVTSSICFFCPKPKDSSFIVIPLKEKKQILPFKMLEPAIFGAFMLENVFKTLCFLSID